MATILEQIEDAILSALSSLRKGVGDGYLYTLRSYGGELTKGSRPPTLNLPAALIKYDGAEYSRLDGGCYEVVSRWVIMVGDNSGRGEAARRRGSLINPGVYRMLEDIRSMLDGQILLTGLKPFKLKEEEAIEQSRTICLYRQLWLTGYVEKIL